MELFDRKEYLLLESLALFNWSYFFFHRKAQLSKCSNSFCSWILNMSVKSFNLKVFLLRNPKLYKNKNDLFPHQRHGVSTKDLISGSLHFDFQKREHISRWAAFSQGRWNTSHHSHLTVLNLQCILWAFIFPQAIFSLIFYN